MPRVALNIQPCPAAEQLANALITETHTDLAGARILWLTTTGKVACKPKVLNPFERYLSSALDGADDPDVDEGYDVVATLNDQDWLLAGRARKQAAMIDHILSHLERVPSDEEDSSLAWRIIKHPIEEFPGVVARHGLWTDTLVAFGATVSRQLPLPVGEGTAPDEEDGPPDEEDDAAEGDPSPATPVGQTNGRGRRAGRAADGLLYADVREAIAAAEPTAD